MQSLGRQEMLPRHAATPVQSAGGWPCSSATRWRAALLLAPPVLLLLASVSLGHGAERRPPPHPLQGDGRGVVSLSGASGDSDDKELVAAAKEKGLLHLMTWAQEEFCSFVPVGCKAEKDTKVSKFVGVSGNKGHGKDLKNTLQSAAVYGTLCLLCLVSFSFLRCRYPSMFSYYKRGGESPDEQQAPSAPPNTFFGWVWPTLQLTNQEIEDCCGLDQAMLIEYCNLVIKIFVVVGFPVMIASPTTFMFGGNNKEVSLLNRAGLEHLKDQSPFFWFYAAFVWYMAVVTEELIYSAQKSFVKRRFNWLRRMPEPTSTTMLVQRIPEIYRSDAALLKYFSQLFPGNRVKSAYVVKRTRELRKLLKDLEEAKASAASAREGQNTYVAVKDNDSEVQALEEKVQEERRRICDEGKQPGNDVNGHSGFVTFHSRHDAQAAIFLRYSVDEDVLIASHPPELEDVFWEDLDKDPTTEKWQEVMGYFLVSVLYTSFIPMLLSVYAASKKASGHMPTAYGDLLMSQAPPLGLMLFTSFLPTILIMIFDKFFVTKAKMWMQKKLQMWYFIFQVIFVVLVTVVGNSLYKTVAAALSRPLELPMVLAQHLPHSSNFYTCFMIVQCNSHCLEITRYVNLIKFLINRKGCDESRARELSEPEDQDYYGIGSRSARWTINAVVGLVFCSVCPCISLLTIVNFLLCKLIYSYLIVFAETRKVDLGGVFWVDQLRHTQWGLWIYYLLTVGELIQRAQRRQAVLAALCAGYLVYSWRRFKKLHWENLPFDELTDGELTKGANIGSYVQPELRGHYEAPSLPGLAKVPA